MLKFIYFTRLCVLKFLFLFLFVSVFEWFANSVYFYGFLFFFLIRNVKNIFLIKYFFLILIMAYSYHNYELLVSFVSIQLVFSLEIINLISFFFYCERVLLKIFSLDIYFLYKKYTVLFLSFPCLSIFYKDIVIWFHSLSWRDFLCIVCVILNITFVFVWFVWWRSLVFHWLV